MKNIIFIVHNLKMGGIQKITVELAHYHYSIGNKVSIICLEKGCELELEPGIDLYTIDIFNYLIRRPLIGLYYIVYKLLLRHLLPLSEPILSRRVFQPEILKQINQIKDKNGAVDAIFVRGARSLKRTWWLSNDEVIYSLHLPFKLPKVTSGIKQKYQNWVLYQLFNNKKMFTVSHYICDDFVRSLSKHKIYTAEIKPIHNPCDIKKVKRLANIDTGHKPRNYIVGVGRLSQQKRFDLLIKAFHMLNLTNYKLVIIGDGNQKEPLQKLAHTLGISDSVIFTGFLRNPYPWYKDSKLFVLSSDIEGFGNVIVEALACGTPVVSTDCGPVNEILTNELAKGLVPKGDAALLSKTILTYIQEPITPTKKNVDRFSFENIVKQQFDLVKHSKEA